MFFGHGKRVIGKILIVEDEPLVAFENENVLTHAGYEVVDTANCCSHAELEIRSTKVDLVVTEIRLTGTRSGMDVAQMAHDRGMDVLVAKSFCPAEERQIAIGCLAKPFAHRDLMTAIEVAKAKR